MTEIVGQANSLTMPSNGNKLKSQQGEYSTHTGKSSSPAVTFDGHVLRGGVGVPLN